MSKDEKAMVVGAVDRGFDAALDRLLPWNFLVAACSAGLAVGFALFLSGLDNQVMSIIVAIPGFEHLQEAGHWTRPFMLATLTVAVLCCIRILAVGARDLVAKPDKA